MSINIDQQTDHEVRIRILEGMASKIEAHLDSIQKEMKFDRDQVLNRIDNQFHWVIGSMFANMALFTTIFGGIILHMAKLI